MSKKEKKMDMKNTKNNKFSQEEEQLNNIKYETKGCNFFLKCTLAPLSVNFIFSNCKNDFQPS